MINWLVVTNTHVYGSCINDLIYAVDPKNAKIPNELCSEEGKHLSWFCCWLRGRVLWPIKYC
jgi:hypothetical protein